MRPKSDRGGAVEEVVCEEFVGEGLTDVVGMLGRDCGIF